MRPRPHGRPLPEAAANTTGQTKAETIAQTFARPRAGVPAAHRATEQRIRVAEECPGAETDQQRRTECRPERRSEGEDDDRHCQRGDPGAADSRPHRTVDRGLPPMTPDRTSPIAMALEWRPTCASLRPSWSRR